MRQVKVVVCILVAAFSGLSCGGVRVNFTPLSSADRLEVRGEGGRAISTITSDREIRRAFAFVAQYETGWKEYGKGPLVPEIMFDFYRGQTYLGGFGFSGDYLVVSPHLAGFRSRPVNVAARDALIQDLKLRVPRAPE
jgi:hypothetical protein